MMAYFPDTYPKGKSAPRDYFFNVLNTLHPDYLYQIMTHANKKRMTMEGEAVQKQSWRATKKGTQMQLQAGRRQVETLHRHQIRPRAVRELLNIDTSLLGRRPQGRL